MPSLNYITFDKCSCLVEYCLTASKNGLPIDSLVERATDEDIDVEIVNELIEFFVSRQILQLEVPQKSIGVFNDLADFYTRINEIFVVTLQKELPQIVKVHGKGTIAEHVRDTVKHLTEIPNNSEKLSLQILCSDQDDYSFFRSLNKSIVEQKNWSLPVRWVDYNIVVGPLIIPNQSACFECYYHRRYANIIFVGEFIACVQKESKERPLVSDSIFESLVKYVTARAVTLIMKGALNAFSPGKIERYDLITGTKSSASVLKLPKCPVCGRANEEEPLRAIRELV